MNEFDSQFDDYRKYLREEVLRFCGYVAVYRQIQERKNDRLEAMNLAPAFFRTVESALYTSIIIWANTLFDTKGERGFFDFLTFIENNLKWLSVTELKRRKNYPDDHSSS
ncbi:hypothetical protein RP726_06835 [Candidatus Methylospira mobilis]|uniref:hypothetical protein n=1 Tax=Candidatus Methylospira mobilis TaxID=1808979 RepID=UPI0028F151DC|nr:hypothetical protein [Candidatus Methylospira mobilis]WNV06125.1 hypothetical protein RP726_06835 [Candidatus Methylospira mobilis]